jgi:hypothetical protein
VYCLLLCLILWSCGYYKISRPICLHLFEKQFPAPFSFFEENAGVLPGPGDGFDAGTGVAVAGAAAAAPFSCSSWRKTAML